MTTAGVPDITKVTPLVDRFFAARRSLKDSPHTTAAYRRDLAAILAHIADGGEVDEVSVDQLTAPVLRDAFGVFASSHAKASITRCWSTWNQFLTFLVAEGVAREPDVRGPPAAAG